MIPVLSIGLLIYLTTLLWLLLGYFKLATFRPKKTPPEIRFTILIPFRNEAKSIPELLGSLSRLAYPKDFYEVIFINDDSDDNGVELLEASRRDVKFNFRILQNERVSQSPKKDALRLGLRKAKHEWILTTDADCLIPVKWLEYFNQCIVEQHPEMICGPVLYRNGASVLGQFQVLDGLSLQLVAMGSFGWHAPLLNNGANLAYKKSAFEEVDGYSGNDHIASGDDVFLLEKMKTAFPKGVYFLKHPDAAVKTEPEGTWSQAIQQRIRWASKISEQKNPWVKWVGAGVFISNLFFLAALLGFSFFPRSGEYYLAFIFMKFSFDVLALTLMASFFNKRLPIFTTVVSILAYPFIVMTVIFGSLNGPYQWKGRTHSK
ncbi:MAG: glycosyltransferase [Flavobacteriaceae bacterium]|nr:glycosyltransferase [Flavobacteriaceae bacterium]